MEILLKKKYQTRTILNYLLDHKINYSYTELVKRLGISYDELRLLLLELKGNEYITIENYSLVVTRKGVLELNNNISINKPVCKYYGTVNLIKKQLPINTFLENKIKNDINSSILSRMREESHLLLGKMLLLNILINLSAQIFLFALFMSLVLS